MSKELDLGSWVNDVVQHLLENYSGAFDSLGSVVSGFSEGIEALLMLPPAEVRQLIRLSRAGRPQPPAISTASLVDGMIN